ncbi:hypothetical protein D3C71_1391780 [compost metagenome]
MPPLAPVATTPADELGSVYRRVLAVLKCARRAVGSTGVDAQCLGTATVGVGAKHLVAHPEGLVAAGQLLEPVRHVHTALRRAVACTQDLVGALIPLGSGRGDQSEK